MSQTVTGFFAGSHHNHIAGGTFVDVKGNIQTCNCHKFLILYKGTYNWSAPADVLTLRRMEAIISESQFWCTLQLEQAIGP